MHCALASADDTASISSHDPLLKYMMIGAHGRVGQAVLPRSTLPQGQYLPTFNSGSSSRCMLNHYGLEQRAGAPPSLPAAMPSSQAAPLGTGRAVTPCMAGCCSLLVQAPGDVQVRVKVVDQERSTAAASGQQDPGWDETLDFAISGEFAQDEDVQIRVEVGLLSAYGTTTCNLLVNDPMSAFWVLALFLHTTLVMHPFNAGGA